MNPLQLCLILSALLFSVGLGAALSRSHAILVLLGVELMLNAANLNFIAFWRYGPPTAPADGILFVVFSIAVAAAEAAVALAITLSFYNNHATVDVDRAEDLKG